METLNLKPQHQDSVIGQLLDLKSSLEYYKQNIAPFYHQMEKWEQKEYTAGNSENEDKFNELKQYVISNESVFNVLLSVYNLSVAVFINKYIVN